RSVVGVWGPLCEFSREPKRDRKDPDRNSSIPDAVYENRSGVARAARRNLTNPRSDPASAKLFFELEPRDFHLDVCAGVGVAHAVEGYVYLESLVWWELGLSSGNHHDGSLFHWLSVVVDNSATNFESVQSLTGEITHGG